MNECAIKAIFRTELSQWTNFFTVLADKSFEELAPQGEPALPRYFKTQSDRSIYRLLLQQPHPHVKDTAHDIRRPSPTEARMQHHDCLHSLEKEGANT
jgi:hypothetical protein